MKRPADRWITEAIWFLGLDENIKPVTPYGTRGQMIQHILEKAEELEAKARQPQREGDGLGS